MITLYIIHWLSPFLYMEAKIEPLEKKKGRNNDWHRRRWNFSLEKPGTPFLTTEGMNNCWNISITSSNVQSNTTCLTNIFIDLGLRVSIHYGIIIRPSLKYTSGWKMLDLDLTVETAESRTSWQETKKIWIKLATCNKNEQHDAKYNGEL